MYFAQSQKMNSDTYRFLFGKVSYKEEINSPWWKVLVYEDLNKEVEIHLSEINYQGI